MDKIGALGGVLIPVGIRIKKVKDKGKTLPAFSAILRGRRNPPIPSPPLAKRTFPRGMTRRLNFLDDLHQLGERLKQAPTMSAVLEYKRAVKDFLRYVVTRTLETEEQVGVKFANPLKKQKKYTLIKVIDQRIEQLAAGVIQNQRQQLDMLKAVDEIYGLLVDLLR